MVTYLGSLVQLCCGEGGTLQANITGVCGECSQCMDHTGLAPAHRLRVLSWATLLRLQVALQGCCPKRALHFVHFPGLSFSGSQVLCKGTDPDGLCILCPSQVQATQMTGCMAGALSRWAVHLMHLPGCSVSWVHLEGTVSGVLLSPLGC